VQVYRWYKIYHLSLHSLLHYLAKFECSNIHLYNCYSIQNLCKKTINSKYLRVMVSFHSSDYTVQHVFKLSVFSKHTCFEWIQRMHIHWHVQAFSRRCFNQNIALTSNDSNSTQKEQIWMLRVNVSNKTCKFIILTSDAVQIILANIRMNNSCIQMWREVIGFIPLSSAVYLRMQKWKNY